MSITPPPRIAVCGAGAWGKNWVHTLAELDALALVIDPSAEVRERVAATHPEVPVSGDLEAAFDASIDGVVLATPAPLHHHQAMALMAAGKDVLVEKPMTLDPAEAAELADYAHANGRILMVGHLLVYQPAIQAIKTAIANGAIGELRTLHQRRAKLGRVRSVEDVLWSFGVHDVAVLDHIVGRGPDAVDVSKQDLLQPGIADDVTVHLDYGDVRAHLHVSWLWPTVERRLVAIGTEGMIVYDELEQQVTLHKKRVDGDLQAQDGGAETLFSGQTPPLQIEAEHFLECIRTRQEPMSGGPEGVAVVQTLHHASPIQEPT